MNFLEVIFQRMLFSKQSPEGEEDNILYKGHERQGIRNFDFLYSSSENIEIKGLIFYRNSIIADQFEQIFLSLLRLYE